MLKEYRASLYLKGEFESEEKAEEFIHQCVDEWKRHHMGPYEELRVDKFQVIKVKSKS